MKTYHVAVDVMGGDHAPRNPVSGAMEAARRGIHILLVGRMEEMEREIARHSTRGLRFDLVPAPEVIGMDEPPVTAIRRKRNSSIAVAARLVRDGKADGMVSAGNTGAVMAAGKLILRTLSGIHRPALTAVIPNLHGRSVLLDVGANVDVKPLHYLQFAGMGHLYSHLILGVRNPRIGLLSIGEEEGKGTDTLREAFGLLKGSSLNFIGNIEGQDVFSGAADVIVCDGFTGNISLKVMESTAEMVSHFLRSEARKSLRSRVGFLLARPTFRKFRQLVDYSEYGGVPLLGIQGSVVVCHGRSSPKAIQNALQVAVDFVRNRVAERIQEEIPRLGRGSEGANTVFSTGLGTDVPAEGGKG